MNKVDKVISNFWELDYSDIKMPIIAIYKYPLDYPDKFVARLFDINKPTDCVMVCDDINSILKGIPNAGMTFFPRSEGDDPHVLGTFL